MVETGRPLRVALDSRVRVENQGQVVTATLVEPVYAFDRIVIPKGTKVIGHVERLDGLKTRIRLVHALQFDFSPARRVVLTFDRLAMSGGQEITIATRVGPGIRDLVRETAQNPARDALGLNPHRRATEAIASGMTMQALTA